MRGFAAMDLDGHMDEAEVVRDELAVVVGILRIGCDHGDLGCIDPGTHRPDVEIRDFVVALGFDRAADIILNGVGGLHVEEDPCGGCDQSP